MKTSYRKISETLDRVHMREYVDNSVFSPSLFKINLNIATMERTNPQFAAIALRESKVMEVTFGGPQRGAFRPRMLERERTTPFFSSVALQQQPSSSTHKPVSSNALRAAFYQVISAKTNSQGEADLHEGNRFDADTFQHAPSTPTPWSGGGG